MFPCTERLVPVSVRVGPPMLLKATLCKYFFVRAEMKSHTWSDFVNLGSFSFQVSGDLVAGSSSPYITFERLSSWSPHTE